MLPPDQTLVALRSIASLAGRGAVRFVLGGSWARVARGSPEPPDAIELWSLSEPTEAIKAVMKSASGQDGAPAIEWRLCNDTFSELRTAAIDEARLTGGWPIAVAPMSLLAAALMAERTQDAHELLLGLLVVGVVSADILNEDVRRYLGVYALADLERIVAEAEWTAMRIKFKGGNNVH